jgi:hypothetical protein
VEEIIVAGKKTSSKHKEHTSVTCKQVVQDMYTLGDVSSRDTGFWVREATNAKASELRECRCSEQQKER